MLVGSIAMNIWEHLVQLVGAGRPPGRILSSAAQAIAGDLHADSCRILLRNEAGVLVLRSRFSEHPDDGWDEVAENLARDSLARAQLARADSEVGSLVAAPMVSRSALRGAIVVARRNLQPFTEDEGQRFRSVASQMVDLIEASALIERIGSPTEGDAAEADSSADSANFAGERVLEGTAASAGIAIGVAVFRNAFPKELVRRDTRRGEAPAERARLRDAFQKTENDLLRTQAVAASELGEDEALIFGAHLMLLRDPLILESIERAVVDGHSAAIALDRAFDEIARRLRDVADPYVQARIEDIEDLRSRILSHLFESDKGTSLRARVVVSPRTVPSVIMELKAQGARGVVSEIGGATSHGVLLARALGVPAVTGVRDLMRHVRTDDVIVVDGDEGRIVVRPSPDTTAEYTRRSEARERARTEFDKFRGEPGRTADGVRVRIQANVAFGVDLDIARENGADGIGLYRTEFAFLARDGIPSIDDQARIYGKAYQAFPEGPISFRVLDLAGDKLLPSSQVGLSRNAFHGYRSIRVLFDYPYILRDQAQAFAIAAQGRALRILVPMVSSVEELVRVKELVSTALAELPLALRTRPPSFGAMIEVPAAIEIMSDLATEVDFFSIGTNDLIQYALVTDREDARLSSPQQAFHPAILRMLRRIVTAAREDGKEVGVCGELAARPELAVALVALGVDTISVAPRLIPELKQKLAGIRLEPLVANLDRLLASGRAAELEQNLRNLLS
jgi:phosphotransferase system enzyme I (PtsP)